MDVGAAIGDELVVDALELGRPPRRGEVLDVIGTGICTHYRVRWDDGRESVFFPGATTHVVHLTRQAATRR